MVHIFNCESTSIYVCAGVVPGDLMKKLTRTEIRRLINEEISSMNKPRKRSLTSLMFEDADPAKIDLGRFPTRLSAVNTSKAADFAQKGPEDKDPEQDDDKVPVNTGFSGAASSLKASQTTMDFGKFIGMAIQMLAKMGNFSNGAGGDLGAIISSDNHIMDGHHRWAATLMVDPGAQVGGIQVQIPGEKLVGVLNVWTASKGQKGKPSDTDLSALTGDAVAARFKADAGKDTQYWKAADLLAKFKENGHGDTLDAVAAKVKANWDSTAKQRAVLSWMPPKVDMPAIEPSQLATVADDISTGKMDINPPYFGESKIGRDDMIVLERWGKLAGILKG